VLQEGPSKVHLHKPVLFQGFPDKHSKVVEMVEMSWDQMWRFRWLEWQTVHTQFKEAEVRIYQLSHDQGQPLPSNSSIIKANLLANFDLDGALGEIDFFTSFVSCFVHKSHGVWPHSFSFALDGELLLRLVLLVEKFQSTVYQTVFCVYFQ
jgi:hypothetical protein